MKRTLTLILVALMCALSANAEVYWYTEGNFTYRIDTEKNCAMVYNTTSKLSGVVTIPANVTYNNVSYLVTEITTGLFRNNTDITGFTYGSYPTYIGDEAFKGCTKLRYFCGTSQAAYKSSGWCYTGTNLQYLGNAAFQGCAFNTVYINSTNLTSFTTNWFSQNTTVTQATLRGELGESAFKDCTSLATVKWNSTIATRIPKDCFRGCTSLTSFPFSEGITSIGESAFEDCPLASIVLPEGFTKLGQNTFLGHRATTITLPSTLNRVYADDFRASRTHTADVALTINSSQIFSGTYFTGVTVQSLYEYAFGVCKIASLTLGPDINFIGEYMMQNVTSLQTLDIQNTDVTIHRNAFQGCTGLTSLTLTARSISEKAFQGCTGLTYLELTCPQIGKHAFQGCNSLEMTIIHKHPYAGDYQAFEGCTGRLYIDDQAPTVLTYADGDGPFKGSCFTFAGLQSKCATQPKNLLEQCDKLQSMTFHGTPGNFAIDCPRLTSVDHYEDANYTYTKEDGCLYMQQTNGDLTLAFIPWGKKLVTVASGTTQIYKNLPRTSGCVLDARKMVAAPTERPTTSADISFSAVLIRPGTREGWMRWVLGPNYIEVPILEGDVNGDGRVSISDVNKVVDLILKNN